MQARKIVVVGSLNMDLVSVAEHIPASGETVLGRRFDMVPGGKGANQAIAAARAGAPVTMIGRVGDDGFGRILRDCLRTDSVVTNEVHQVAGASGVASVTVARDGSNAIVVTPGANDSLSPAEMDRIRPLLQDAGVVLAQLETPMATIERLAEICEELQIPLLLDPAPAQPLSSSLLRRVTWLTPNELEADLLLQHAGHAPSDDLSVRAARLLQGGPRNVVLKLGARGVFLAGQDVPSTRVNAFEVVAVDTTAAGDAFNGAFAVGLLEGFSPEAAARFACAAAALSTTVAGAQPSMPTRAQVQRLLNRQKDGMPQGAA